MILVMNRKTLTITIPLCTDDFPLTFFCISVVQIESNRVAFSCLFWRVSTDVDSDLVIPRLKEVASETRLLVMLRDPVKRAYSHYQMAIDPEGTPAQLRSRGRRICIFGFT